MGFLSDFHGRPSSPTAPVAIQTLEPVAVPENPTKAGPPSEPPTDDTDEEFYASLCDQVSGLYQAHQAGQLEIDAPVRLALQQARQVLVATRPASLSAPTALRVKAAAAETAQLLASTAAPGTARPVGGPVARDGARLPSPNQSPPVERAEAAARPSPIVRVGPRFHGVARRIGSLSRPGGSGRGTKLVTGALMATVAVSLAALFLFKGPNAGDHPTIHDALTSQNAPEHPSGNPPRHNLSGSVAIVVLNPKDQIIKTGQACKGAGGYSDVRSGGPVTVVGEGGRLIATGRIGAGSLTANSTLGPPDTPECRFSFEIPAIPYSSAYTIRFWDRRPIQLSYEELVSEGWSMSMVLEDSEA
jgi:hypothetical protein